MTRGYDVTLMKIRLKKIKDRSEGKIDIGYWQEMETQGLIPMFKVGNRYMRCKKKGALRATGLREAITKTAHLYLAIPEMYHLLSACVFVCTERLGSGPPSTRAH